MNLRALASASAHFPSLRRWSRATRGTRSPPVTHRCTREEADAPPRRPLPTSARAPRATGSRSPEVGRPRERQCTPRVPRPQIMISARQTNDRALSDSARPIRRSDACSRRGPVDWPPAAGSHRRAPPRQAEVRAKRRRPSRVLLASAFDPLRRSDQEHVRTRIDGSRMAARANSSRARRTHHRSRAGARRR